MSTRPNILADLFSQTLGIDCDVIDEKDKGIYKLILTKPDQIPTDQSAKEFLSKYWGNKIKIDSKESTIEIDKSSAKAFEKGFNGLNGVIQLHEMAKNGDVKTLEKLSHQGLDVDATNINGETLLISATYATNASTAEFILEHEAKINQQEKLGATALHVAVKKWVDDVAVPVGVTTTQEATSTGISLKALSEAGHFSQTPQVSSSKAQEQKFENLSLAN